EESGFATAIDCLFGDWCDVAFTDFKGVSSSTILNGLCKLTLVSFILFSMVALLENMAQTLVDTASGTSSMVISRANVLSPAGALKATYSRTAQVYGGIKTVGRTVIRPLYNRAKDSWKKEIVEQDDKKSQPSTERK